jgi:hypothetical protein
LPCGAFSRAENFDMRSSVKTDLTELISVFDIKVRYLKTVVIKQ